MATINWKAKAQKAEKLLHQRRELLLQARDLAIEAAKYGNECSEGRFADLPARMVGHNVIGNVEGMKFVAHRTKTQAREGRDLLDAAHDFLDSFKRGGK